MSSSRTRARALFALKLAATTFAFWLLFQRVALSELIAAAQQISALALASAFALQLTMLALAAVRWKILLRAYGARHVPAFAPLFRVHLVGNFYNTYLPGAIGGDVLRGVATRSAFGDEGTTQSVAVVFIDRVLGLLGLLTLSVVATSLFAADRFGDRVLAVGILLLSGLGLGIVALGSGPRLARFAPAPLAKVLTRLPLLVSTPPFLSAVALAIVGHILVACCGHVLVQAAAPQVRLADSFVAMPLASGASFFPLTIAGAGARDLAMVQLYVALGYPREVALAGSFALLLTTLLTAGLGGLVQLLVPLEIKERP